jgi:hypothetical protein
MIVTAIPDIVVRAPHVRRAMLRCTSSADTCNTGCKSAKSVRCLNAARRQRLLSPSLSV